jgi:DNA topoisomerase-1
VVSLLDATLIRIGNSQYAKENRSYGLTTLRNKHVEVRGGNILFEFRGKSGVEHRVSVKDRRLANVIKRCMELPGQNLFQYLDDDGLRHNVTSSDINAYLHNLTGSDFTAKDYRTWAASAHALATLRKLHWEPEADAKKHIVQVVKEVSKQLGNTPAICRKCYIHPAVLEGFLLGNLAKLPRIRQRKGLRQEEVALVHYLRALADKVEEAIEEAQA